MTQYYIPEKFLRHEEIGTYTVSMVRHAHIQGVSPKYDVIVRDSYRKVTHVHDLSEGAAIIAFEQALPILQVQVAKEAFGLPSKRVDLAVGLLLLPN